MSGVDDKIVVIKFENEQFERKIQETIRSLDKLRQSLDMSGAKRGLDDLSNSGKRFNLNNVGAAADGISNKFLAMATVGITALANITNRAVDAGIQITKAFTIAPIQEGFREYETQLNSVQTILANTASKGTTLEQVNDALQLLNEYSDKTIYNFGQMARNIGTFTAAGVDLDTSVNAIKGIANLAALSGSNPEQASTAMYQLSQALSSGTLKLMDWQSVVNAGMGGEVFKTALFETGKALGTLKGVPVGQTFKEWTDAGNVFRETLQDGWITADVLTTTLSGFTGDMTEEMLIAKGFTQDQATQIMKTAAIAKAAATQVKTFTQLIGTVKEAIGTGWADSFKIVIGNFTEARELWTNVNNIIGGIVSKSANARNELLQGWKDQGGRDTLIAGFFTLGAALASIVKPIKEAFRDIFPAMTVDRLVKLTEGFRDFAQKLIVSGEAADKIKSIFRGFFALFEIGFTIIKEIQYLIWDVVKAILPSADAIGDFGAGAGDFLTNLNESLVAGGGIKDFFNGLSAIITKPIETLKSFANAILGIFGGDGGIPGADQAESIFDRISARLDNLAETGSNIGGVFSAVWDRLGEAFSGVRTVLETGWDYIADWFDNLGEKFAEAFDQEDFDSVIDALNVGLLGGIVVLLKKFLDNGLSLDFGGGLFGKISETFGELTNTLKAMQADLKANALLKIAAAIAILTASVLVLSLIDSVSLTKALIAMSVGFGQLITAFALLNTLSFTTLGAVKLAILAAGLILLAGAALILTFAVKNLSDLDWNELAKGLTGIVVILGALSGAVKLMSGNAGGMISAGLGMIAISIALLILSAAVKQFAEMDWGELAKGLSGVAVGLGAITLAMRFMPTSGMIQAGIGIIAIAIGMRILANAMQAFATMSWEDIGKGLVAVGLGLGLIVLLTNTMPVGGLVAIGVGLILVSIALRIMANAVQAFASMPWQQMLTGIGGLAAVLLILVVATNAMNASASGAAALVVVSAALWILAEVIEKLAKLSIAELATALAAIAATFLIIALGALLLQPATGAIFALGTALAVVGGAFALFGLGVMLVAKGFEILAKSGEAGAAAFVGMLGIIASAMPKIVSIFAQSIIDLTVTLLEAAPILVEGLKILFVEILKAIIELAPLIADALVIVISEALDALRQLFPEFVQAGFDFLIAILSGIRDNISEIVTVVADIITGFLDALSEKTPEIVDSVFDFLMTVLTEVAFKLGESATAFIPIAQAFIDGFITGLEENVGGLIDWFKELPDRILDVIKSLFGINSPSTVFMDIGKDLIVGLYNGITQTISMVMNWFLGLGRKVLTWIGNVVTTLFNKGANFISGLLKGIVEKAIAVTNWFVGLGAAVLRWIGNVATTLKDKGISFITGLFNGVKEKAEEVIRWFGKLPGKIIAGVGYVGDKLTNLGKQLLDGFKRGLVNAWDSVKNWFGDRIDDIKGFFTKPFEIFSPSKLFMGYGKNLMQGFLIGLDNEFGYVERWFGDATDTISDSAISSIGGVISTIASQLDNIDEFNPIITPVLDLTKVEAESKKLNSLVKDSTIVPEVSFDRASLISFATTAPPEETETPTPPAPTEVKFEQNIYAPQALSTADIYRNTKSQITLAKEELGVS